METICPAILQPHSLRVEGPDDKLAPLCHPPMYPVARVHKSLKQIKLQLNSSLQSKDTAPLEICSQVSQGPGRFRPALLQMQAGTPSRSKGLSVGAADCNDTSWKSWLFAAGIVCDALLPHDLLIGHLLASQPRHHPLHDDVGVIDLTLSLCYHLRAEVSAQAP